MKRALHEGLDMFRVGSSRQYNMDHTETCRHCISAGLSQGYLSWHGTHQELSGERNRHDCQIRCNRAGHPCSCSHSCATLDPPSRARCLEWPRESTVAQAFLEQGIVVACIMDMGERKPQVYCVGR